MGMKRSSWGVLRAGVILAAAFAAMVGGCAMSVSAADKASVVQVKGERILFIGNSITKHGPNKGIGWLDNWGMAASAEEKDYVHRVVAGMAKRNGKRPEYHLKNVAKFEREYGSYDIEGIVTEAKAFKPDLVILAIGENVPSLKTVEDRALFREKVGALVAGLCQEGSPALVVRSSFWANGPKDEALKDVCEKAGGIWVDIHTLCKDEANYARSEREFSHAGVAKHPGDRGMQAIADAILAALPPVVGKASK